MADYLALPLGERKAAPAGVTPPAVAVVGTDGGRVQVLDEEALTVRGGTSKAALARKSAAQDATPAPAPTGEESRRFWREDKLGLLMAMTREPALVDPCPDIPETVVDATRMRRLVRELRKGVPRAEEPAGPIPAPAVPAEAWQQPATVWQPSQVQEKRLLASRQNWEAFVTMVAAAAWAMGLFAAGRAISSRTTAGSLNGPVPLRRASRATPPRKSERVVKCRNSFISKHLLITPSFQRNNFAGCATGRIFAAALGRPRGVNRTAQSLFRFSRMALLRTLCIVAVVRCHSRLLGRASDRKADVSQ